MLFTGLAEVDAIPALDRPRGYRALLNAVDKCLRSHGELKMRRKDPMKMGEHFCVNSKKPNPRQERQLVRNRACSLLLESL